VKEFLQIWSIVAVLAVIVVAIIGFIGMVYTLGEHGYVVSAILLGFFGSTGIIAGIIKAVTI
jgi:hypothetical protein